MWGWAGHRLDARSSPICNRGATEASERLLVVKWCVYNGLTHRRRENVRIPTPHELGHVYSLSGKKVLRRQYPDVLDRCVDGRLGEWKQHRRTRAPRVELVFVMR